MDQVSACDYCIPFRSTGFLLSVNPALFSQNISIVPANVDLITEYKTSIWGHEWAICAYATSSLLRCRSSNQPVSLPGLPSIDHPVVVPAE